MITQKFKGDSKELKMEAAAKTAFDVCSLGLDDFKAGGYDSSPFLLMLYDEGRMPFADRVPRASFVAFIKEAIARFPFTGTFEAYIFILNAIFGDGSGVLFNIPGNGKLEIAVNAAAAIDFDFQGIEVSGGAAVPFNMVDDIGNQIIFGGISGIDSEFELQMLLAEIIPGGVFTSVSLAFFALYNFVDNSNTAIVDHLGNQIVFIET